MQDGAPSVVLLRPSADLRSWSFGETIHIEAGFPVDLEGFVVLPDGFIVCSEDGPRVIEVERTGHIRREIPVPERFREAQNNKSLESLTMSPSGPGAKTTAGKSAARQLRRHRARPPVPGRPPRRSSSSATTTATPISSHVPSP